MRLLAISDYHGKTDVLPLLRNTIGELKPDGIIFTGDVVKGYARGDEWLAAQQEGREPEITAKIVAEEEEDLRFYEEFFTFFENAGIPLFAIPGNMDAPVERYSQYVIQRYQKSALVKNVHDDLQELQGFGFAGFGGQFAVSGAEAYFVRIYLEDEAIGAMQRLTEVKESYKLALLFHHPPEGKVGDDQGVQKGSRAVNRIIEMLKPTYVFCGHAHKARAIEKINDTVIINPGALKDNYYALVDTTTKTESLRKLS
ncbi:MAG: metallophosphoesterase [Candidatus Hodarchaeota archaeon]